MNLAPPALQRLRLRREAAAVAAEATRLHKLDTAAFADSLAETRAALRRGRATSGELATVARALAHLEVVATRARGLSPRAAQLQAALSLYRGKVVWLPADAGKSLAVALAAVLHAWSGHSCRVAAATAYLARRDSEALRPLFAACGLSLACVTEAAAADPVALAQVYAADVVYAGARQALADSLREQILRGAVDDPLRMRLRGLAAHGGAPPPGRVAMLVDDADLVLIDDAGSPLIISAPGDNPLLLEALNAAREAVESLRSGRDYRYQAARRDIQFSMAGEERLEELAARLPGIWHESERRDDLIRQAIGVRDLLQNGRHYRVEAGKVVILDDGIGRVLAIRSWAYGLVQAIEAREGLALSPPSRTLARMSYPAFFRRQAYLGGIGRGQAGADAALRENYGLACVRLAAPETPAPVTTRTFHTREEKRDALIESVARLHAAGKSTLIVIRRMGDGEAVMRRLAATSIPCELLNAGTLGDEAVARLTEPGRVSLALSSVLHGVTLPAAARARLHLLLIEPHDLAHADRRAASLSDAGAQLFLALDDDLLLQQLPRTSAWLRNHPQAPRALPALKWLSQALAMRGARKQGKLLLRRDAMLNQQLAFTGEQDIDLGIYALGNPGKDRT